MTPRQSLSEFAERFGSAIAVCAVVLVGLVLLGLISFPLALAGTGLFTLALAWGASTSQEQQVNSLLDTPAEAAPTEADPSIEQLIEAWPEPAILLDENQVIKSVNETAGELLEHPRTGDPISFRLRDPGVLRAIERAINDSVGDTQTLIEKIPTERRIRLNIQPFDRSGLKHALLVLHDESTTYRLERMRSDFVANASHELRTPLASITGCIETLRGPARDDPEGQERFLQLMGQQAKRMSAIINDLLSLNRIEMQAHRRPTDTVDLAAIVEQAIDLVQPDAEASGLTISLLNSTAAATVRGDQSELHQVALNLLENAVKYGASGGRVDVEFVDALEGGARMIELRVRDYGGGIKRDDLPRVTERFYRAHESSNPQATGTGLGLAIVKHIVARHRGTLVISSEPGEGATFLVKIPYQASSQPLTRATKIPERNQR